MIKRVEPSIQFLLIILCMSFCSFGMWSCAKKSNSVIAAAEQYFIVGSGGGVSGQYEQFKVFEKGQVQFYDFDLKKYVPYSTLSTSLNETLWIQLKELNIEKLNLDDPGNYNYYVHVGGSKTTHKVKWSDESQYVPKNLKQFFSIADKALREMK